MYIYIFYLNIYRCYTLICLNPFTRRKKKLMSVTRKLMLNWVTWRVVASWRWAASTNTWNWPKLLFRREQARPEQWGQLLKSDFEKQRQQASALYMQNLATPSLYCNNKCCYGSGSFMRSIVTITYLMETTMQSFFYLDWKTTVFPHVINSLYWVEQRTCKQEWRHNS